MDAFEFKNKTILLVSPQKWGEMHISKHHYAIELANRGNRVYFVNPPSSNTRGISFKSLHTHKNIHVVTYGFAFLNQLKFKWPSMYDNKIEKNLKKIIKSIDDGIDILWTFDLRIGQLLLAKGSYIKIAHPVDFTKPHEIINADGSTILISVAQGILDEFDGINVPKKFINHGISESFIGNFNINSYAKNDRLRFGYVGNLLRFDIDHQLILKIINENTDIDFIFYGNTGISNISGSFTENSKEFIADLKASKNVDLKGIYKPELLAKEMNSFDGFFLCYDKEKDVCRGTNYHKIMEYLSTGRVVISNFVETYHGLNLVQMPSKKDDNSEILNIFKDVIANIDQYNAKNQFEKRQEYAKDNSYIKQVNRIEKILQHIS